MNRREKQNMELPQDANILLSYVNLKLRDFYSSLDALCDDMDVSRTEIEEKLSTIGYHYQEAKNQFIS